MSATFDNKMSRGIAVFCALVSLSLASITVGPLEPKPEKFKDEEGCYIRELDAVIPFNQSVPSKKECLEYSCNQRAITYATCIVVIETPCEPIEDKEKPYPYCCPRTECPKLENAMETTTTV